MTSFAVKHPQFLFEPRTGILTRVKKIELPPSHEGRGHGWHMTNDGDGLTNRQRGPPRP